MTEDGEDEVQSVVSVLVDDEIIVCDCCGKDNLKHTLEIITPYEDPVNLGVICAGQWFKANLTGNIYYAARKLENQIKQMTAEATENVLNEILADMEKVK